MFRLKATLVATTLMRPWRNGWPVERGVDFSLTPATEPATPPPETRDSLAPAEPACFIDEDCAVPPCGAESRSDANLSSAETALDLSSGDAPEVSGLRAWWSMASKSSQT